MENQLQGKDTIKEFILGGIATFTIRSKVTQSRFTYRARLAPRQGDAERPYFVSVLRGEDNTGDYAYLGCIWPKSGRYVHGKKSRIPGISLSALAFRWLWRQLSADEPDLSEMEFFHAGTCARCGRLLTVPESIQSGWGPVCAKERTRDRQLTA